MGTSGHTHTQTHMYTGQRKGTISLSWCRLQPPKKTPPTAPVLSPLLYVAPQMPMLPCNSCLTMCPTKCCHPMEGRGSEEGGFGWGGRKGGCWVMNINFFLSFFSSYKGAFIVYVDILFLALSWSSVCIFFFYVSTLTQCFYSYVSTSSSTSLTLSHVVLDSVEVMASPLPVTGSPWKQSGEGGNVRKERPFYWCSRLTTLVVSNDQERGA